MQEGNAAKRQEVSSPKRRRSVDQNAEPDKNAGFCCCDAHVPVWFLCLCVPVWSVYVTCAAVYVLRHMMYTRTCCARLCSSMSGHVRRYACRFALYIFVHVCCAHLCQMRWACNEPAHVPPPPLV